MMKVILKCCLCTCLLFTAPGVFAVEAIEVGLAWVGKSGMSNRVTTGLFQRLEEIAPQIVFEDRRELSSMDDLEQAMLTWEGSKQGVVILRSSGAKWLSEHQPKIPTFTGGHTHPKVLGVAALDSVTGVTYHLSKVSQFSIFKKMMPKMRSFMLLLEKGHAGTEVDQQETLKVAKKMGLKYNEFLAGNKTELVAAVTKWRGKVDAFVIGNQALIFDAAKEIVETAQDTVVISYNKKPIKEGALGGFVPDDESLGRMLADSMVDVLVKNKSIDDIPYKKDPSPIFYVNKVTLEKHALSIPRNVIDNVKFVE